MTSICVEVNCFRLFPGPNNRLPNAPVASQLDFSGTVLSIGPKCRRVRVGDVVLGRVTFSHVGVVDAAHRVVTVPEQCAHTFACQDSNPAIDATLAVREKHTQVQAQVQAEAVAKITASMHGLFARRWLLPATRVALVGLHTVTGSAVREFIVNGRVEFTVAEGLGIQTNFFVNPSDINLGIVRPTTGSGTCYNHLWTEGTTDAFDLIVLCCDPGIPAARLWNQAREAGCTHSGTRFVDLWSAHAHPWRAAREQVVENAKSVLRNEPARYTVYWPRETHVHELIRHGVELDFCVNTGAVRILNGSAALLEEEGRALRDTAVVVQF